MRRAALEAKEKRNGVTADADSKKNIVRRMVSVLAGDMPGDF